MLNSRSTNYFFLRASFILSPGLNSEAPLDTPVVEESFILSPGANSDAPREVGVVELFCVPGANPEAPFVAEPAKLRPDDPIRIAAEIINVFFMSFSFFISSWLQRVPNFALTKRFAPPTGVPIFGGAATNP